LLPSGLFFAQEQLPEQNAPQIQQQSPSTTDLESQPNVYHYPGRGRRRPGFPQPNTQPPDSDPPANPDPPAVGFQPNNSPQPNANLSSPPGVSGATAPAATANPGNRSHATPATGATQNFIQPAPGSIGPPAPLPLTLEQMSPTPPKIVYQNGLLSVESVNSRLIDILNGIRTKAGIQFEGMQAFPERVAGKFGPAPADQVLASLLQGTHLDYVIIGLPENPSLVQRVLLTPNSGAATAAAPGAPQPNQEMNGDEEDNSDDSAETPEQAQPQQTQQPVPGPQNPGSPKTPEQLLEELKQMQQRNQRLQQQNPPQAPLKPTAPR
jgi:hypothetical protein